MRNGVLPLIFLLVLLSESALLAIDNGASGHTTTDAFVGQDLHLSGRELISYQLTTGEHTLVFQNRFSMSIGANRFSSDTAVVWLQSAAIKFRDQVRIDYKTTAYLQGNIVVQKANAAKTTDLRQTVLEEGRTMIVQFEVSGEVFVTANNRSIADPRGLELYAKAVESCRAIGIEAKFITKPDIVAAELPPMKKKQIEKPVEPEIVEPQPGLRLDQQEISFKYPVNIAPMGEVSPQVEWDEDKGIGTMIGRFYLWQKQDESGRLLELQADNGVIFYSSQGPGANEQLNNAQDILAKGAISAIYLSGDVVMTEGQRTIRADETYYDFDKKKALAINAVMRNFDVARGVPIYVRAAQLRQLAENKFAADNITLTTSEFYLPQISLNASEVVITDTTSVDEQQNTISDRSYDAQLHEVCLKMYDKTIFYWPSLRSNLQRPDIPFKSINASYDNTWGASAETRWHLSRLLGLREPQGTDSTLMLDYYSKRGIGSGVDIEYERENYFGKLLGYIIHDTGDDDLSRHFSRKNLEPPHKLRGRLRFQHRHFLPYGWQVTTELGYASDENFIEQYYRNEFNSEKEQETIVHLKRIEDNWGLSLLGKARINDFADELEELPTAEFHWTGQSLFNDKFTLYSDTQVSRLQQKIGDKHAIMMDEGAFSFASHRTELDIPIQLDAFKIVPFVAGTLGYDDRSGFTRSLVDGTYTGQPGENDVWIGEAGMRVSTLPYWKVYPDVKSRLWDLNQLRHIIRPYLTAVAYTESDSVVEQHDILNVGISQRLQTKRGSGNMMRTVDWMRLNTEFTWVDDSESAGTSGADRFLWNKPFVPLRAMSAPGIYNGDLMAGLQRFEMFGPKRSYIGADYIWNLSDTTAILSDINYDVRSGVVQQLNFGFSHLRWPNLSYYIGSRYLRRVQVLDEEGTNAFTFAATYALDPRYTIVFSQQFDFDYGDNIRSDITLLRRYHRLYWALTYSVDESLDRQAIAFSIWPQGVPEMALGPRRYTRLAGPAGY